MSTTTIFESPTALGAKILTVSTTITNTSGAYTATVQDERLTTAMKAIKLELGNPAAFDATINVAVNNGSLTITCASVAGTSTAVISVLKVADDPTAVTSTEFDVLANRMGDLDDLTTTAKTDLVSAVNETKSATTTNAQGISSNSQAIANINSKIGITVTYNSSESTANNTFAKAFKEIDQTYSTLLESGKTYLVTVVITGNNVGTYTGTMVVTDGALRFTLAYNELLYVGTYARASYTMQQMYQYALKSELDAIGRSYTYTFPSGDKSYSASSAICSISVPAGTYLAMFTPGYTLTAGVIGISCTGNRTSYLTLTAGWSGTLSNVVTLSQSGVIDLYAVNAVSWQNNHSDFYVIKLK